MKAARSLFLPANLPNPDDMLEVINDLRRELKITQTQLGIEAFGKIKPELSRGRHQPRIWKILHGTQKLTYEDFARITAALSRIVANGLNFRSDSPLCGVVLGRDSPLSETNLITWDKLDRATGREDASPGRITQMRWRPNKRSRI